VISNKRLGNADIVSDAFHLFRIILFRSPDGAAVVCQLHPTFTLRILNLPPKNYHLDTSKMVRTSFSLLFFWPVLFARAMRPSLDAGAALDLDGSLALLRRSLRRLRSDRSEGDFEPQDAEEAAGVSELTMYMANFTKEMLG
jgi:hypothetical protein